MATDRSQQILEQIIKNGTFAPDFAIETESKTFRVHRFVIAQATSGIGPATMGVDVLHLDTTADVAEDLIRQSYGLHVSRLQPVDDSKPTGERMLQVLELFIMAQDNSLSALEDECRDWLHDSLTSWGQDVGALVEIAEYLYKRRHEYHEVWDLWPDLVGDLADSMGEILATREDLLERIINIRGLHRRVLQELFDRLEAANEAIEDG